MSNTKIGLGLAAIGRPEYINLRHETDIDKSEAFYREKAFNILSFAYDQGIRHFDTAPSYGKGEEFLQQWYLKNPYQDLSLSTKWGYTYMANWELGYAKPHEIKEHSLHKLKEQWSVSRNLLPALKTYQIHSATFESGVLENAEVHQELHRIKKTTGLKIGLSASGVQQNEILEYASKIMIHGEPLFESFQVTYNVLEMSTHDILKKLINAGKSIIIKEALANGRIFKHKDYGHYANLVRFLESLAVRYGVSIDAIGLRFVMDILEPALVLSGASTQRQLAENLRAQYFKLDLQDQLHLKQFAVDSEFYWNERKNLKWH
ncbi:aldo/keto reductase [Lutimonas zeaxanthinifaciens]|uniref:aldo/keto reductase n=1 Tax=Lutimonas zeaxanthinifaciens TaxID=3060215 RepID=UPI00265CC390|nr:aldo/keto reductase [Lutimonas sp. YSD2104]WKK67563.1 aldo/keto reductase [Lutimonas sp. YSD2104]